MTIISEMYERQAALGIQRIISDFQHGREVSDWKTNAKEWQAHAQRLERRLAESAEKLADVTAYNISNDAKAIGRGAVIDVLVTELAKLDPSNPLLDQQVRNKINDAAQAPVFERAGWRLLPEGGVEKI